MGNFWESSCFFNIIPRQITISLSLPSPLFASRHKLYNECNEFFKRYHFPFFLSLSKHHIIPGSDFSTKLLECANDERSTISINNHFQL